MEVSAGHRDSLEKLRKSLWLNKSYVCFIFIILHQWDISNTDIIACHILQFYLKVVCQAISGLYIFISEIDYYYKCQLDRHLVIIRQL